MASEYEKWIKQEVHERLETPEYWKPVPGFEDRYTISSRGQVKNIKTGRIMKHYLNNQKSVIVALSRDGLQGHFGVRSLVWKAFVGPIPKGMRVVNKNHSQVDCGLEGLTLISNIDWSRYRGSFGKPVIKIAPDGKIVGQYKTVQEAAEKNGYTLGAISHRIHRPGRDTAADGCDYALEDDNWSIRRALKRLGLNWEEWNYDES